MIDEDIARLKSRAVQHAVERAAEKRGRSAANRWAEIRNVTEHSDEVRADPRDVSRGR